MKTLLPIENYDETGKVKPPNLLYLVLLFFLRPILVFIASITFREDMTKLLTIFYPDNYHFYLALVPALPALFIILVLTYREKLWAKNQFLAFKAIPALLLVTYLSDFGVQFYILESQSFRYHWSIAYTFVGLFLCALYLFQSQQLRMMLKDWSSNESQS